MKSGDEWREWYRQHPGGIAIVESPSWLKGGCPKCGGKKWEVTGDCWAYCLQCSAGYATAYAFARKNELRTWDFDEAERG